MSSFKQKNEQVFLYAKNRLTHRLELQLDQIELKCEQLNLIDHHDNDDGDVSFQKKYAHKMMMLKKLNEIHLGKMKSFQSRVCFFENFIRNNASRQRKADRSLLLDKILLSEMEHKRKQRKFEGIFLLIIYPN
jgi:hypothetical protein